jgi:hypothetical protein
MGFAYERHKVDYAKAVTLCETGLAMFRILGSKRWVAVGLYLTGHAARSNGDFERAVELYRENLVLFGEVGDKWVATECIEGLALITATQGNDERAARLFGAAEAARETYGITMPPREAVLAATKERPQEAVFAAAWTEGAAMTLEQAIEYALAGEPG